MLGRRAACWLGFWLWSATAAAQVGNPPGDAPATGELFDAVWTTVRDRFYDPKLHGVDWPALRDQYRPRVLAAATPAEQVRLMNDMLRQLDASHTELLTRREMRYYHLRDVFFGDPPAGPFDWIWHRGRIHYAGIGVFLKTIDEHTFVKAVWPGFPADQAGLLAGDEILSADGQPFQEIDAFAGKLGTDVRLRVQSMRDPVSARDVVVRPRDIQPGPAFLEAQRNSVRIEARGGVKVGYMHIWSYAHTRYQDLLVQEITQGRLKDADALLIDLREGLGGAHPKYLNVFTRDIPALRMTGRDGTVWLWDEQWRKPAALLVNEGTTSGKEAFAFGFQRRRTGRVVGTRTAGAVLGGSGFLMPGNNLLYLAIADVTVDGQRLERVGVTPDVEVPLDLPYCQGRDPQFDRAVDLLVEEARGTH